MYFKLLLSAILMAVFFTGCGDSKTVRIDDSAPEIYLNGQSELNIIQFNEYVEYGAFAIDDVDGEVEVSIEGSVDTSTLGTYLINYTAVDSKLNSSTISRTVNIVEEGSEVHTNIDVLVLYSAGAKSDPILGGSDVETFITHMFTSANQIFESSEAYVNLNVVHMMEYDMDDSLSSDVVLGQIKDDSNISTIRNTYKADEVVIFRPYANDGMCGVAYLNNLFSVNYAYAHVSIDCTAKTLAHEIGHNLGLDHGYMGGSDEPHLQGLYYYSIGHFVEDVFGTVMTYASQYSTPYEYVFSNPTLDCINGLACGIFPGEDRAADATSTIVEVKQRVSEFK